MVEVETTVALIISRLGGLACIGSSDVNLKYAEMEHIHCPNNQQTEQSGEYLGNDRGAEQEACIHMHNYSSSLGLRKSKFLLHSPNFS
jgi:hypothetical protein